VCSSDLDIEFPENWKLPKKYVNEEKVMENEKSKQGYRVFSFVSEFNEKLVDETIYNIKNIIDYNKEREEKERLFQVKVDELKKMFENENLNNLQALKFEITEEKIELDDAEETIKPVGGNATMVK
jgi:hypothetical protein